MSIKLESLFTGIFELETFFSRIQSSEIFNTFLYEKEGILTVKLKTERLDDAEKATEFFKLMCSYQDLKPFIQIVPVEPYKSITKSYQVLEYHLRLSDIEAAKLTKNLDSLVSMLEKIEEIEVSRNNKILAINVKVINDPELTIKFVRLFFPLLEKLKLSPYLDTKLKNPVSKESIGFKGLEYHIDLISFLTNYHTARLQSYYSLNKEDLAKSMTFLLQCGWDEKRFNSIGVARSTYFRFKAQKQENNPSQVRQQHN